MELAAIHDFNPMISKSFAMRYACRQADCGLIPRAETDWFIAQQHGIAREYWFCAACGGEFKYSISRKEVDSRGQDKQFQHVIFMNIPGATAVFERCAQGRLNRLTSIRRASWHSSTSRPFRASRCLQARRRASLRWSSKLTSASKTWWETRSQPDPRR